MRTVREFLLFPLTFAIVLLELTMEHGVGGTWRRWRAGRIKFNGAGHAWVLPDHVSDQQVERLRAAREKASK